MAAGGPISSAKGACLALHKGANDYKDQPIPSSACRDLRCKMAAFIYPRTSLSHENGYNACRMFLSPYLILHVPTAKACKLALMPLGSIAGVSVASHNCLPASTCPRLPQPRMVAPPHNSAWVLFRAPSNRWRLGRLLGKVAQVGNAGVPWSVLIK